MRLKWASVYVCSALQAADVALYETELLSLRRMLLSFLNFNEEWARRTVSGTGAAKFI